MIERRGGGGFLKFDVVFLLGITGLLGLGIVIIYSSSGAYAESRNLPGTYFLVHHLKKVLIALAAFFVGVLTPFKFWSRVSRPLLFGIIALLIFLITSSEITGIHGAKRWVRFANFGLQPSELAKMALVFFLARTLTEKAGIIGDFKRGLLKSLPIAGIIFGLVLMQPDYSSAIVLLSIAAAMLFAGGARLHHLAYLGMAGIPLLGYLLLSSSYRRNRLLGFLFPIENVESAYQSLQSLISLGNGGITGTGLGTGTQKLGYLPMPFTDTIFSILGEELGLIGTLLCLSLFAIVLWRGLRISYSCNSRFGSLTGVGIVIAMAVTVVIHVGVCTGFFPATGQVLPFVSYGGTALCTMMFFSGVMLNISGSFIDNKAALYNSRKLTFRTAMVKQRLGAR